jgi:DNA-binding LacI/PurR family transcriptional regulator
MLDNRVSGLVFLSHLDRPDVVRDLVQDRLPVVFIAADQPWADSVTVNEHRGGEMAAHHLIGLGHRRMAFVLPSVQDRADSSRLEGFRRVVTQSHLEPVVIRWDPPDGVVTVADVHSSWPELLLGHDPLTAIFAANDFAAIDLLDVADALGVHVPEDLSIVGFDDIDMARLRRISLTTVSQPRQELVELGVDSLMGRLEGRVTGAARLTLASVSLAVRGSSGAPATSSRAATPGAEDRSR